MSAASLGVQQQERPIYMDLDNKGHHADSGMFAELLFEVAFVAAQVAEPRAAEMRQLAVLK